MNGHERKDTAEEVVRFFREWADRLPGDPDDMFWFERPCEVMQEMFREWADRIERAGEVEYRRGLRDGLMRAHELCLKEMYGLAERDNPNEEADYGDDE